MALQDEVKELIVEQLGVSESEVTSEARFVDDLGADSLDTVELIMAFEDKFDVEIPDDEAQKMETVSDVIKYLESNKS